MRRSISFIIAALATGILCIFSPVAGAATLSSPTVSSSPNGTFGVRLVDVPVSEAGNPRALRYIIDYLPTGTVIHRRILIANGEARTARFTVYADAAAITAGQFSGDTGATRSELTSWVSVQHPTVTVAAGASVTDLITISVPAGATRGEHYGVIWVQQTGKAHTGSGSALLEVSRVGVRVYLAVGRGGAPPTSFDITSVTGRLTTARQPLIVAHVSNTGGRAIDLNGTVRLADGPGNTSSGPFSARQTVTLAPGQSWNVTFAPPKSLPEGSWRATTTLASGLTTATATATVELSAAAAAQAALSSTEWIWLAFGGLVVAALVIAATRYARQHRRRRASPRDSKSNEMNSTVNADLRYRALAEFCFAVSPNADAGLTAWTPAGGTAGDERPLVGSATRAPRRDLAAAAVTYSPGTASQGFGVFGERDARRNLNQRTGRDGRQPHRRQQRRRCPGDPGDGDEGCLAARREAGCPGDVLARGAAGLPVETFGVTIRNKRVITLAGKGRARLPFDQLPALLLSA